MNCVNANPETLKKLYWEDNLSLADIGGIYGTSKQSIRRWFKKFNIPRRSKIDGATSRLKMLKSDKINFSNEIPKTLKNYIGMII